MNFYPNPDEVTTNNYYIDLDSEGSLLESLSTS